MSSEFSLLHPTNDVEVHLRSHPECVLTGVTGGSRNIHDGLSLETLRCGGTGEPEAVVVVVVVVVCGDVCVAVVISRIPLCLMP